MRGNAPVGDDTARRLGAGSATNATSHGRTTNPSATLEQVIDASRHPDGYCLLRQDARLDHWTALQVEGIDVEALTTGAAVAAAEDPVHVTLSAWGRRPSDFLEHPCFLASAALRAVLDSLGVDNVQYFPAEVRMELTGEVFDGYSVGNVVGTVSCVDREASAFEAADDGESGALRGFRIDASRASGWLLFRLAEDRRLVVVHDRVADALQSAGLRGLLLQHTLDYDGYPASTDPEGMAAAASDVDDVETGARRE